MLVNDQLNYRMQNLQFITIYLQHQRDFHFHSRHRAIEKGIIGKFISNGIFIIISFYVLYPSLNCVTNGNKNSYWVSFRFSITIFSVVVINFFLLFGPHLIAYCVCHWSIKVLPFFVADHFSRFVISQFSFLVVLSLITCTGKRSESNYYRPLYIPFPIQSYINLLFKKKP